MQLWTKLLADQDHEVGLERRGDWHEALTNSVRELRIVVVDPGHLGAHDLQAFVGALLADVRDPLVDPVEERDVSRSARSLS